MRAFYLPREKSLHQDPASDDRSATSIASRLRQLAHDRIVEAFRAQVTQGGPGPSDEALQNFARLAWIEHYLKRNADVDSSAYRRLAAEVAAGEFADRLS
jgi:hypothetical protein